MTRALNKRFGKRLWFVAKSGQTPVEGEEHLHHLVHTYLPKHQGLYWRKTAASRPRAIHNETAGPRPGADQDTRPDEPEA